MLNFHEIVLSGKGKKIRAGDDSIAWGNQVLRSLRIDGRDNFEKAQRICGYLSDNFAFNFQRSTSLREIITRKGGNCVAHSLIGIFLLRLAGIPAKFAHEVHLTRQYRLISLYVGLWAKKENNGINSFWHNDHVWVWFSADGTWQPFDSALDLCGFDRFYRKRFFKHKELSEGFAQKWTGPPFVVWEGVGEGFDGMKNITPSVINPDSMIALEYKEEWLDFIGHFENWTHDDFQKEYLPDHLLHSVKAMSIQWFRQ